MHFVVALPHPAETGGGGGTDYIAGLAPALRALGHRVDLQHGPSPRFDAGAQPIVDGMLLPHLRDRLDELAAARAVALVHHLSAAAGRHLSARDGVRAIEADMLPRMHRVVATSEPVAARLSTEFGIAAHAIPPGARTLPRATPDPADPVILAVGVFTPRKAHDRLLAALARLDDLPWRVVIAGDADRDPAHAAHLGTEIRRHGLGHRASLHANPYSDTLERAWSTATVFALATTWEGYPAAAAEAMRRGIPVVTTDVGGAAQILPVEAAAICPVDDMATFGKCLRRLLFDLDLRADMTDAAWRAGQALPSWEHRAEQFISFLEH